MSNAAERVITGPELAEQIRKLREHFPRASDTFILANIGTLDRPDDPGQCGVQFHNEQNQRRGDE